MKPEFIPLNGYRLFDTDTMMERAKAFYNLAKLRRTVRDYSEKPVCRNVIDDCIRAAGTAPSGANMQPWHFAVAERGEIRRQLREAAEREELEFYESKAPQEWLDALAPLGTDSNKPFLETAPYLIGIFVQNFGILPDGRRVKHYYATESVGIATGILISALHHAGLATLTNTPSPMGFLNQIFHRPKNERPFLLPVTGQPDENALVPKIERQPLENICSTVR